MRASSTRAYAAMCATGVAASLFLTAPLTAQNGPRGRLVVAAEGSSERGVGGGFLVEPTGTGQRPVPITGLPPEFTGSRWMVPPTVRTPSVSLRERRK